MKKTLLAISTTANICFFSLFVCLFFSESYVKLLVSTQHLEKEKHEVLEKILNQTIQSYLKFHDFSGDNRAVALTSLTDHLIGSYNVLWVRYGKDSIIICNIVIILIIYKITTNNRLLVEAQPK